MSNPLDPRADHDGGLGRDKETGAHLIGVVGDWFMRLLEDPQNFWRALEDRKFGLSDKLCKDITSAPYVDYLREKICDEEFRDIDQIAGIANRARDFDPVDKYPHTIILLLGLGRRYLTASTELYALGVKSYEHYGALARGARGDSGEEAERWRSIVLETGIQLYRREDNCEGDEKIWEYLQLEFKFSDSLLERRMQFHLTEDSCELYERTKRRWLRFPEKVNRALREGDIEYYGALTPQMLDLPVPYDSADALDIVEEFSKALRGHHELDDIRDKQNRAQLAKNLRILQWDIFTRDLLTEQAAGTLSYQSSLDERGLRGFPPDEFLEKLTKESWEAHCNHVPLHSGILRKRYRREGYQCRAELVSEPLKEYRAGFNLLLNDAAKYNPTSYEDTTESFSDRQHKKIISKAIIVEDGELTFFIFLWLLRQAASLNEDPRVWRENPSAILSAGFRPTKAKTFNAWCVKEDLASFGQACGLLVPSDPGDYILTRRWRSFLKWLQRQRKAIRESRAERGVKAALPVKKVIARKEGTPEHALALALQEFFGSEELKDYLARAKVFPDEVSIEEFAQRHVGPLIDIAARHGLLRPPPAAPSVPKAHDEPWPYRDILIFRLSRAGFLPLEHLFRAYQPYELHLLILALSFTQTEMGEHKSDPGSPGMAGLKSAPISLAFATIAGALPPNVACGMSVNEWELRAECDEKDRELKLDYVKRARQWLAPYWTLFTALATELSVGKVQKASRQLGVAEILNAFSHEVGKISAYIFSRFFIKMGDAFHIEGQSPAPDALSVFVDEDAWRDRAGEVKPHPSATDMSEWRVCPTPATLRSFLHLYSIWIGSKVTLTDIGIDPGDYLKTLVDKLLPIAREMAVARERADQMNPIRSLRSALEIERRTRGKISGGAEIAAPMFTPPADRLKLNTTGTDSFDTMLKVFLVRALLAGLSNALKFTASDQRVTVGVTVNETAQGKWVEIEIVNPSAAPLSTSTALSNEEAEEAYRQAVVTKSKFSLGTEAVMNTCAKQLGGEGALKPFFNEEGLLCFRSTIRFPLPGPEKGDDIPWITLEAEERQ